MADDGSNAVVSIGVSDYQVAADSGIWSKIPSTANYELHIAPTSAISLVTNANSYLTDSHVTEVNIADTSSALHSQWSSLEALFSNHKLGDIAQTDNSPILSSDFSSASLGVMSHLSSPNTQILAGGNSGGSSGLVRETYTNEGAFSDNLTWFNSVNGHIPDTSAVTNDLSLDHVGIPNSTSDRFSGYFIPKTSGVYQFFTNSDDGSFIYLGTANQKVEDLQSFVQSSSDYHNANLIVDNHGIHGNDHREGSTPYLVAGTAYPISAYFYQGGGGANFEFGFKAPGEANFTQDGTGYCYPDLVVEITLPYNDYAQYEQNVLAKVYSSIDGALVPVSVHDVPAAHLAEVISNVQAAHISVQDVGTQIGLHLTQIEAAALTGRLNSLEISSGRIDLHPATASALLTHNVELVADTGAIIALTASNSAELVAIAQLGDANQALADLGVNQIHLQPDVHYSLTGSDLDLLTGKAANLWNGIAHSQITVTAVDAAHDFNYYQEQGYQVGDAVSTTYTFKDLDPTVNQKLPLDLKALQNLSIDAIAITGSDDQPITGPVSITLDAGADVNFEGVLPHFENNVEATLNISTGDQLHQLAQYEVNGDFNATTGIDHIELSLSDQTALSDVLSSATLTQDLANLRAVSVAGVDPQTANNTHLSADTIDVVSSHIDATNYAAVQLDAAQAQTLITDGLSFAAGDHITLDVGHGTHLGNSLKELQKLGIDAVALGGDAGAPGTLELAAGEVLHGNLGGLPNFGLDLNGDGILTNTVGGLTEFSAGHVTLDVGAADLAGITAADALTLQSHGIEEVRLELSGQTGLESIFDAQGNLTNTLNTELSALHGGTLSTNTPAVQTTLDVGHTDHLHLNAAQAQTLITDGLSFAAGDHITLDVGHGTHLGNSLKELQKLGIDAVALGGDAGAPGTLELAAGEVLHGNLGGLPNFGLDLNGDGILTNTVGGLTEFSAGHVTLDVGAADLAGITAADASMLQSHGVDHLAISESLNFFESDWMRFGEINAMHSGASSMDFRLELHASGSGLNSFDQALMSEFQDLKDHTSGTLHDFGATGIDLLGQYAAPGQYGALIDALTKSGVTDFVVESKNIEIGDSLAAALVDSGMLHALPSTNMVIDAAHTPMFNLPGFNDLAPEHMGVHLFTSMNDLAQLGVDHVSGITADHVYIDLGRAITGGNQDAIQEISDLLDSLDPAHAAKPIFGVGVSAAMVINSDMANLIHGQGGLSADLVHALNNIGINEIDVLANSSTDPSVTANLIKGVAGVTTDALHTNIADPAAPVDPSSAPVAQTVPVQVQVKIIGADTDPSLYDHLLPHQMPQK